MSNPIRWEDFRVNFPLQRQANPLAYVLFMYDEADIELAVQNEVKLSGSDDGVHKDVGNSLTCTFSTANKHQSMGLQAV